jgi:hypothetical protein
MVPKSARAYSFSGLYIGCVVVLKTPSSPSSQGLRVRLGEAGFARFASELVWAADVDVR